MNPRMIVLKDKGRIKVSTIPGLIANATYPDDVPLFSDTFLFSGTPFNTNEAGEKVQIISDPPYMMRFLQEKILNREIHQQFESGELQLICSISQGPVQKDYLDRTNPMDCLIAFDDFVTFASKLNVCVVAEDAGAGSRTTKKPVFDRRLSVLKKWLEEDLELTLTDEIIILPKHYTLELVYTKLGEKNSSLFLSIELTTFDAHFWGKQKIVELMRGNKAAIM